MRNRCLNYCGSVGRNFVVMLTGNAHPMTWRRQYKMRFGCFTGALDHCERLGLFPRGSFRLFVESVCDEHVSDARRLRGTTVKYPGSLIKRLQTKILEST